MRGSLTIAIGTILGAVSAHVVSHKSVSLPPPHVEEFIAKFRAGTTPFAREPLTVRITGDRLILLQKGQQFIIPLAKITLLAYSAPKAKRYFAALQWGGATAGEVVLSIERQDYRRVIGVLTAALEQGQPGIPRPNADKTYSST